jgi:glycogen synthase
VKICHVTPIYLPGILPGCSTYIRAISEGLAKTGYSITLLTSNAITGRGWVDPVFGRYSATREETINGVRVRRLKNRWQITSTLYLLRRIAGPILPRSFNDIVALFSAGPYVTALDCELKKERYDLVHITAFPFGLFRLAGEACKAVGIPYICTPLIHFQDPAHRNPLLWMTLQDAAGVIACSGYEREGMIRMGIERSRIHLIPMGIHLTDWGKQNGERFRERYHLQGKKIVLFAGTKAYNKGAIHVLEAVRKIEDEMKDLKLVAIGPPTREWLDSRGLASTSLLDLGYVSEEEKRDAFAACDVFAMPSRYDSFGIVYLEAWQCTKPVVGARIGAIPEIIEEGRDGLLVEFGNVEQLASALLLLLKHPELCRRMGETGKEKIISRFNWEKNLCRFEEAYEHARKQSREKIIRL